VDGEVLIVAAVSPSLLSRIKAGDLVKTLAGLLGGGGGGRPEAAQGKGKDCSRVQDAAAAAVAAMRTAGLR
jgi:alanyl-tRNA synthetase